MILRAFIVLIALIISACSSQEQADFHIGQTEISKEHYQNGLGYLDKVIKRNKTKKIVLQALREAARISYFEIKDYKRALRYYHGITLKSPDPQERKSSQKIIAEINFDNLQNYQGAILEFSKLLLMNPSIKENYEYKTNIARAWYYTNNFFQALAEVESLLKEPLDANAVFEIKVLKANIYLSQKKYKEAAEQFIHLIQSNPERSGKENIILSLAVCYEENFDYKSAINILEKYKNTHDQPEYVDIRIKRLKERMKNAPGAHGFRK